MVLECLSERLSRRFFCTLRPIRHKGPRFSCILSGWVLSAAARCAVSLFWALSMWLFHLYSILKIQSFPHVLGDPRIRHFAGYPFGSSRKKASAIFYDTAYIIPRVFPRRKGRPVPRSVFSSCSIRRNPAALHRTPWARPCAASRWPLGKCKGGATRPNSIPTAPSAPCPLWRAASCSADKEKHSCWICS